MNFGGLSENSGAGHSEPGSPGALMGLAPLARMAFEGADLNPVKSALLERLQRNDNDANALMDLATVSQFLGQRRMGLSMQAFALDIQRVFRVACAADPGIRLLGIFTPGDLAQNNALEFLVEGSDIRLDMLYVRPGQPLPATLPEHDLAMVAVCETDGNRPLLRYIEKLLQSWPRPVICAPHRIARLSRDGACRLLRHLPGVVMPATSRIDRRTLEKAARSGIPVTALAVDGGFPIIVRPVDSQKGRGLAKLDDAKAIAAYLERASENTFYAARYIDYRGPDGQFRKYRIVLIDGRPYACHMAISDRWVVHYMSAGMRESAAKRAEEERFFATFDDGFARRHGDALRSIAKCLELEYVGLDCAEAPDGKLLIFEVDSGMTVHSMDPPGIFPYKPPQMAKVFGAFRRMLLDACAAPGASNAIRPPPGNGSRLPPG